jgi:hypothetical protein
MEMTKFYFTALKSRKCAQNVGSSFIGELYFPSFGIAIHEITHWLVPKMTQLPQTLKAFKLCHYRKAEI